MNYNSEHHVQKPIFKIVRKARNLSDTRNQIVRNINYLPILARKETDVTNKSTMDFKNKTWNNKGFVPFHNYFNDYQKRRPHYIPVDIYPIMAEIS